MGSGQGQIIGSLPLSRQRRTCLHSVLDLGQLLHRFLDSLLGVSIVLQLTVQVVVVGSHVEMPVAAQVEENGLLITRLLAFFGQLPDHSYGVVGLRSRDDPL